VKFLDMTTALQTIPSLFSFKIWAVQMVAYHGFGLWFEWLDRTGRGWRFKVKPPERRSYAELLPRVLANQLFLLLPAMVAVEALGLAYVGPSSLSPLGWAFGLVGLTVGHDVVQYVAHRLILHRPANMRSLGHLLHHTTSGSRAITACYMSAADFFLEIVCPYLIPLILVGGGGSDMRFHSLVVIGGAFGGLYEHSGYDFGLGLRAAGGWRGAVGALLSSEAHSAHHSRGNVSFSDGFGSSNICDTLFGTRWDLMPDPRRVAVAASQAGGAANAKILGDTASQEA
jgi:sterol desaturase/sphingolipid hydroxylase (fatty acid hydroxylase superfamily)